MISGTSKVNVICSTVKCHPAPLAVILARNGYPAFPQPKDRAPCGEGYVFSLEYRPTSRQGLSAKNKTLQRPWSPRPTVAARVPPHDFSNTLPWLKLHIFVQSFLKTRLEKRRLKLVGGSSTVSATTARYNPDFLTRDSTRCTPHTCSFL